MDAPDGWLPIEYRDFHDFPRAFFVRHGNRWLYVAADFDVERDDFSDFAVFDMGDSGPDDVGDDWRSMEQLSRQRLGTAALTEASFDPTRRGRLPRRHCTRSVASADLP